MAINSIEDFSGGEKARLALAMIVWQRPNLLLLDEPTNHLDLETREALTVALAQFEGTLVLVSHDRHLLRATTDQFLIVADGRLQPFDGDLDDYRDWLFKTKLGVKDAAAGSENAAASNDAAAEADLAPETMLLPEAKKSAPADRRAQKRRGAEQRQRQSVARKPLETRLKRLDEQLAKLNAKKAALDAQLADPALYGDDRKEAMKTLVLDQAYVARELAELEAEWLTLQEQLDTVAQ